jgi:hypothetical protein
MKQNADENTLDVHIYFLMLKMAHMKARHVGLKTKQKLK